MEKYILEKFPGKTLEELKTLDDEAVDLIYNRLTLELQNIMLKKTICALPIPPKMKQFLFAQKEYFDDEDIQAIMSRLRYSLTQNKEYDYLMKLILEGDVNQDEVMGEIGLIIQEELAANEEMFTKSLAETLRREMMEGDGLCTYMCDTIYWSFLLRLIGVLLVAFGGLVAVLSLPFSILFILFNLLTFYQLFSLIQIQYLVVMLTDLSHHVMMGGLSMVLTPYAGVCGLLVALIEVTVRNEYVTDKILENCGHDKRVDADMTTYLDFAIGYVVWLMKYQGTSSVMADTIVGNRDEFKRTRQTIRKYTRSYTNNIKRSIFKPDSLYSQSKCNLIEPLKEEVSERFEKAVSDMSDNSSELKRHTSQWFDLDHLETIESSKQYIRKMSGANPKELDSVLGHADSFAKSIFSGDHTSIRRKAKVLKNSLKKNGKNVLERRETQVSKIIQDTSLLILNAEQKARGNTLMQNRLPRVAKKHKPIRNFSVKRRISEAEKQQDYDDSSSGDEEEDSTKSRGSQIFSENEFYSSENKENNKFNLFRFDLSKGLKMSPMGLLEQTKSRGSEIIDDENLKLKSSSSSRGSQLLIEEDEQLLEFSSPARGTSQMVSEDENFHEGELKNDMPRDKMIQIEDVYEEVGEILNVILFNGSDNIDHNIITE